MTPTAGHCNFAGARPDLTIHDTAGRRAVILADEWRTGPATWVVDVRGGNERVLDDDIGRAPALPASGAAAALRVYAAA